MKLLASMVGTYHLILFLLLLCLYPIQAIVPPTFSNSTGQYYIATKNYQFERQEIICNHTVLCYFGCNFYRSCHGTSISASSANVIVNCNTTEACGSISRYLYDSNSGFFDFSASIHAKITFGNGCRYETKCYLPYLYCPYSTSNSCHVIYTGDKAAYIPIIIHEDYALNWLNAYGPSYIHVQCTNGSGSVISSNSILMHDNRSTCDYHGHCCPYSDSDSLYVDECVDGTDCIINCSSRYQTTRVESQCGHRIINASLTKSISVICPDKHSSSCKYLQVICPINGGDCNVTSHGDYALSQLRIDATGFVGENLNINLNCNWQLGCYGSPTILANNTIGKNININVHCNRPWSCNGLSVYSSLSDLNNINILCNTQYSCSSPGRIFYLNNSNNVNVLCNGKDSCTSTYFYMDHSNNINFHCYSGPFFGADACCDAKIYSNNVANIKIAVKGLQLLQSNRSYGSNRNCEGTSIFAINSTKLGIICKGDETCSGMNIDPPSNVAGKLVLKCYDGSCDDVKIHIGQETNIERICESEKACNYVYACSNDVCSPLPLPLQGTTLPATKEPTKHPRNPAKRRTSIPTKLSTYSPIQHSNDNYPPNKTNISSIQKQSTYSNIHTFDETRNRFGAGWIALIISALLILFMMTSAAYIKYKTGIKKQMNMQFKQKPFQFFADSQTKQQNIQTEETNPLMTQI
eukprot:273905_1